MLSGGVIDIIWGLLFIVAFFKTKKPIAEILLNNKTEGNN